MFHLCWSFSRSGTHVRTKMRAKKVSLLYYKSNFRKMLNTKMGKFFSRVLAHKRKKFRYSFTIFFPLYLLHTWKHDDMVNVSHPFFAIYIFSTCSLTHERSGLSWKLLAKEFHISDRVQVVEWRDNLMYNAMITKKRKLEQKWGKFMHGYFLEKGKDYFFWGRDDEI